MEKEIKNWLESAEYDLETAGSMLQIGRYLYTVFLCHLTVEKALKAKIHEATGRTPPKTHDLIGLLKLSELVPPGGLLDFLGKLNNASVATRYPEDFLETVRVYTEEVAEEYLRRSGEVVRWITRQLKP
ncbi:MAG: HEPN domain-containing protein [Candidatus Bipolaricaulota bacterium]|nr:HEPN domain-containing protein [Candidatus Bipolaricaulota bacterium]